MIAGFGPKHEQPHRHAGVSAEPAVDSDRRFATKSLYQYTLHGHRHRGAVSRRAGIGARMAKIPGLQDVTTDLQIKSPK